MIFTDQFARIRGAKANSLAACIGGHNPSDLRLIKGLLACRRWCVPALAFAGLIPVAVLGIGRTKINCWL
jgi:hypothetical protein